MAPPRRRACSPPAVLMEELVEEILFRIPPDEPAHLIRAALVCKLWRRVLSDHGFHRRYRAFHKAPPLLGYLHNLYHNKEGPVPPFVVTTVPSPPLSLPALVPGNWWALDCRHGRMLIHTTGPQCLIVWDPITGEYKQLKLPPYPHTHSAAAVLCARDGCGHLDCHGGPFLVVFVGTYASGGDDLDTWASVYSSETGVWSEQVTIVGVLERIEAKPSLLIGDALYFTLECGTGILKYDVSRHALTEIEPPGVGGSIAMEVEDGALGFIAQLDNCIYKWLWQSSANNGKGRWGQHMVLELEKLLPRSDPHTSYEVMSFVEDTDTILISGSAGVFTLDLKSRKVKKVGESEAYYVILPYRSFYTPDLVEGRTVTAMEMQ